MCQNTTIRVYGAWMFYVQKHTAPMAVYYHPPLVGDKPLRAPAFVKFVSWHIQ